jgi:protein involved in polysaccharide export with SLBB domain
MFKFTSFLFFGLLLHLGGCASDSAKNPEYTKINNSLETDKAEEAPSKILQVKDIPQFEDTEQLMAPGFLFSLNHPSDEKIRGQFRVAFDGILRLPYGVKVHVKGMNFHDLRARVLNSYTKFFQRGSEDISFQLIKRQYWVEIRGYVRNSGFHLVERKESIDRIISKAKGLRGDLAKDSFIVAVKQMDTTYSVSLNQYYESNGLLNSFVWTGGDTIFVNMLNQDSHSQSVPMVSVIGGVLQPGTVLFKDEATIFYYLNKTGGVVPNLDYDESFVIRKIDGKIARIKFNITDMNTVPAIKAADVIMLNAEKRTWEDKVWDRVIQVSTILTTIAFLIIAL